MKEVYERIYGNHSGSWSLVHKLIRAGYYWPTMRKDAQTYVKACDKCQRFSNVIRQPIEELTLIIAPWPFAQWGLNIMGPFSITMRQLKFLIVGIDYFTKWVEPEVLASITEKNVRSFVWKNIVYMYGILRVLVSDNEKQFDNDSFRDFCLQLGIKNHYSLPPTLKPTGRLRLRINPCLKSSRLGSKGQRVYGLKSCQAYYGRIEQHPEHPYGRHCFG